MQTPTPKRYFDNPQFKLEETGVVMLRTSFQNHEAAISLNEAYRLELTRIEDLQLDGLKYPVYIYQCDSRQLSFIMIATPVGNPPNPCFDYYDKMLLIRGRDAQIFQQRIYDDLTEHQPEPPTDDILRHNRWELLEILRQGVFEPATFNFKNTGKPVTSLYSGPNEAMPRKLHTQLRQLEDFLGDVFPVFEWHLTNPEILDEITRALDDSANS